MTMANDNKLSDRLKGMLLETTAVANSSPSSSRPLIEVIRSDTGEAEAEACGDGSSGSDSQEKEITSTATVVPLHSKSRIIAGDEDDDEEDEDDAPPPISFRGAASAKTESSASSSVTTEEVHRDDSAADDDADDANGDAPSLAERMLADAAEAKRIQRKEKTQQERRKAEKSTFGMKKGFLNSSADNKKKAGNKSKGSRSGENSKLPRERKNKTDDVARKGKEIKNLVYELDDDGNMIPSSSDAARPPSSSTVANDPLRLPEVQSAMLSHLQSKSSEWATPDLLDSIPKNHPELARGMNNPRHMRALQEMQSNPKETLSRLKKSDPDIVKWLVEFCGVMGEHFCKLGEGRSEQEEGKKKGARGGATANTAAADNKMREMGPLEEKALRTHKKMQASKGGANSVRGNEALRSDPLTSADSPKVRRHGEIHDQHAEPDSQVASILANDELRSILMDPKMQQIMEECAGSEAGKFRYYMSHKEYGPKLRMMMEAGLIRLA